MVNNFGVAKYGSVLYESYIVFGVIAGYDTFER